ncbi:MAG TPA: AraC family transcriptional regulator [Kofleriaceae bacterium]|nr:AraC family transcriptional regulator [Kofleriaceae bacterium]
MDLVSRPPTTALAPFVESLWRVRGHWGHSYERILPTGTMKLLVNLHDDEMRAYPGEHCTTVHRLGGAILCGAHTKVFAIDTAEQRDIIGVDFRPGGAFPFFAVPCDAAAETQVELATLWDRDGAVLRERLLEAGDTEAMFRALEATLLARGVAPLAIEPSVLYAISSFERGVGVTQVTKQLGMTPARFVRLFSKTVGLTPKRYSRLLRFHRVLDTASCGRRVDWARVALDCGYFDQAHLIHEFRELSGMRPTAYRPRSHLDRTHVPMTDREILTIPTRLEPAR